MAEKIVMTRSADETSALFGAYDANIRFVERAFSVRVANQSGRAEGGDCLVIRGESDAVAMAQRTLEYLRRLCADGETISEQTVRHAVDLVRDGEDLANSTYSKDVISVTNRGKPIKAKTLGQSRYVDLIREKTVVLGLGPAGTGKTFLAVAMAVEALRQKTVDRIILTRPAVEAGERLGFLPGDLQSKIDPYLRPLYDALFELLGPENYQKHLERGTIEIAPLAYMRGRTLDSSFIILDEAQNTTPEQMKMFLTRLGFNSRAVVTGDLSQTDLPFGKKSGLLIAHRVLSSVEGVGIHEFTERDVVRHPLVRAIIGAYEKYERESREKKFRSEGRRDG